MLSKVVDSEKGELENHYNGLGFRVATTRHEEKDKTPLQSFKRLLQPF